jgi:hypothetical protein
MKSFCSALLLVSVALSRDIWVSVARAAGTASVTAERLRELPVENINACYALSPQARASVSRVELRGGPLPTADTPEGVVQRLLETYRERDLNDYAALLSAHFFFDSSDPEFRAACPYGRMREDQIKAADRLFHGYIDAAGRNVPAARWIELSLTDLHYARRPAPVNLAEPMQVVVADGVRLTVHRADGSALETGPLRYIFFVERERTGEIARGQPAEPGPWMVRMWLERPDGGPLLAKGPPAAPPPPPPRRPRPADSTAATSQALTPRSLAFLRVPNPAREPLRLLIEVPEHGSAQLEAFDVQGRSVSRSDLGEHEPGDYTVPATSGVQLAPGLYWFRLTQGRRSATTRIVVLS